MRPCGFTFAHKKAPGTGPGACEGSQASSQASTYTERSGDFTFPWRFR